MAISLIESQVLSNNLRNPGTSCLIEPRSLQLARLQNEEDPHYTVEVHMKKLSHKQDRFRKFVRTAKAVLGLVMLVLKILKLLLDLIY
jgi:hypothetical protein